MVHEGQCPRQPIWSLVDLVGWVDIPVHLPKGFKFPVPILAQRQSIAKHLCIGLLENQSKPAAQQQNGPRCVGNGAAKLTWSHDSCWTHHQCKTPRLNESVQVPCPMRRLSPARQLIKYSRSACISIMLNQKGKKACLNCLELTHSCLSIQLPSGNVKPVVKRAADTQLLT